MKKMIAIILVLTMLLAGSGVSFAETTHVISTKMVPLYVISMQFELEIPLYFMDEQEDIPWISMTDAHELLLMTYQLLGDAGYQLTMETEGKRFFFIRENGSMTEIDFEKGRVIWDDYNLFTSKSFADQPLDMLSEPYVNEAGEPLLFYRDPASFSRKGENMELNFAEFFQHFEDFSMELVYQDGMGYLPLQTFSDLFMAQSLINLGYNGEAVFVIVGNELGDMREAYYAVEPKERSEEMAIFNYLETCLALQFHYGLKEHHEIPSFGTFFEHLGIDEVLMSPDALTANQALSDVVYVYLDDMHSKFQSASPYAGDVEVMGNMTPYSRTRLLKHEADLLAQREKAYPDGCPGYEEIGNTAFVTFDEYTFSHGLDYYADPGAEALMDADTIGLIMYAHKQITRENSPIENVVLDMSLNKGGTVASGIYTIGWMLGECDFHLADAMTRAQASLKYRVDVNGDHVCDEKDSISHLNLFCLTSPVSFSCGNLVPCSFKASSNVTLIGRPTSGGACSVQPLVSADGTLWRISSRMRLSTLCNGAFYDVDQGVEPDVVFAKDESYYDRQGLTDMINAMK